MLGHIYILLVAVLAAATTTGRVSHLVNFAHTLTPRQPSTQQKEAHDHVEGL